MNKTNFPGQGPEHERPVAERPEAERTGCERVFVGLGSNSENAFLMLERGREAVGGLAGVRLLASSPVYVTEPQEMRDQPWFHNQVLEIAVDKSIEPVALMTGFLELESALGRVRSADPALRYGPRAIDIDLLLFGERKSDHPVCLLPHPRLLLRAFWLVPLLDLAPDLAVNGTSVREHLARLDWHAEKNMIWQ